MNRQELEHIIRAGAAIVGDSHLVVIGSQAILGQYPEAPAELLLSMEADVYPKHHPENAIVIDGAIGELSLFHETFGYYARGVAPETAILPEGWQEKVVAICNANTHGLTGECLEAHDLAVSKLAAGREKDLDYVRAMLAHRLVNAQTIDRRIAQVQALEAELPERLHQRLRRLQP